MGVVIFISEDDQIYMGNGGLIAPNLVITCAHNLFIQKKRYSKVLFIPAPNVEKTRIKKGFMAKKIIIPEEYKSGNKLIPFQQNKS